LLRAQEQERLEEILRHSKEEEERMQRLEQEQLNEILRISQQQQQEEEENSQDELERVLLSLSQLQIHNNDDDEQLKNQALQQSLHDVHAADDEFHRALSLSLQECNQDESVSIHNTASSALELSIITESTTIEMLQEQVGYVIEEVD
jgi:gas vesicle protein